MRVFVIVSLRGVCRNAAAALGHAVALLEASLGEFLLQALQDLWAYGGGAGAEAREMAEVVFVHERVAHHADEDGRDEEEF